MIDPMVVLTSICSMLLLMIPGFFLVRTKMISADFAKQISKITLYAAQPCMIIAAFFRNFDGTILSSMAKIFILSLISYIIVYFIVFKMFAKTPVRQQSVLRYMMIFSNCGFMGFPLLKSIFGTQGDLAVLYGAVLTIWFNIFAWTLGIKFFSDKKEKIQVKELIFNPGVVGVVIGVLLFVTSATQILPGFIVSSVKMLGDAVTPLAMIVIGMRLAEAKIFEFIKDKKMLFAHAMRLLILPAVIFVFLKLISLTGFINQKDLVFTVIFILLAMPSASNTAMMAELYGGDSVYASGGVTLSTLLSMVTIPIMSLLLQI